MSYLLEFETLKQCLFNMPTYHLISHCALSRGNDKAFRLSPSALEGLISGKFTRVFRVMEWHLRWQRGSP